MMSVPFRRLLLATEHTEQDRGAEALAFALAAHCGLPLGAVLPVTSNPELEMEAPGHAARLDAAAARHREALQAEARAAGVVLALAVRRGAEPFEEIVAEARERAADLLVIRRRGRRGLLAKLLIGEMVGKVVAHAPCSVLVVPRGATMWRRGVIVGVDPQAPEAGTVALAAALARECRLPLRLVCVAETAAARGVAAAALAEALQAARALHPQVVGEVREGRPHQALIDATQAHAADLLVIGRRGPTRLARAWIGGTAQKVIGLSYGPVLVHIRSDQGTRP